MKRHRHHARCAQQPAPASHGTTKVKLSVIWPEGVEGPSWSDFSKVLGRLPDFITMDQGNAVLWFPAPFEGLVLRNDEVLSLEKALLIKRCIEYFNLPTQGGEGAHA